METNKPLSLSAAIRLGSMLKPQGFGHYAYQGDGSCALVAAAEAMGISYVAVDWQDLIEELGVAVCPECGVRPRPAVKVITVHLNDKHKWTRERIADFVEQIENKQESVSGPEPVEASK